MQALFFSVLDYYCDWTAEYKWRKGKKKINSKALNIDGCMNGKYSLFFRETWKNVSEWVSEIERGREYRKWEMRTESFRASKQCTEYQES